MRLRPGAVVGRAVVATIIAGACWLIGLDVAESVSIALVAVALHGLRQMAGGADEAWRVEPDTQHNVGTRREVARLSWSLHGQEARVDRWSAVRLHNVAAGRLAERGLDLESPADAPAIRGLLGDTVYRTLIIDPNHPPRYTEFVAALGVLERLTESETVR